MQWGNGAGGSGEVFAIAVASGGRRAEAPGTQCQRRTTIGDPDARGDLFQASYHRGDPQALAPHRTGIDPAPRAGTWDPDGPSGGPGRYRDAADTMLYGMDALVHGDQGAHADRRPGDDLLARAMGDARAAPSGRTDCRHDCDPWAADTRVAHDRHQAGERPPHGKSGSRQTDEYDRDMHKYQGIGGPKGDPEAAEKQLEKGQDVYSGGAGPRSGGGGVRASGEATTSRADGCRACHGVSLKQD